MRCFPQGDLKEWREVFFGKSNRYVLRSTGLLGFWIRTSKSQGRRMRLQFQENFDCWLRPVVGPASSGPPLPQHAFWVSINSIKTPRMNKRKTYVKQGQLVNYEHEQLLGQFDNALELTAGCRGSLCMKVAHRMTKASCIWHRSQTFIRWSSLTSRSWRPKLRLLHLT